jgi:ATP-dependent DNA helicase PIF1
MVGRAQMGKADRRLRQIFPADLDETLGGIPSIFFGDFGQLPPVGDSPLYSTKAGQGTRADLVNEGRRVFEDFTRSVTLSTVYRQSGPEQSAFRDALLRLRVYQSTVEDLTLFSSRFWDTLSAADKEHFNRALHLLPTRVMVFDFNVHQLNTLGKPAVRCKAKHNKPAAKKATDEDAEGLEKEVLLAEGAHVMVTRNLWTSKGLVNGTQGVVRKIWYHPRSDPKKDLPAVVFVDCPGYTGEFSELHLIDVDTDQVFNRSFSSGLGRN